MMFVSPLFTWICNWRQKFPPSSCQVQNESKLNYKVIKLRFCVGTMISLKNSWINFENSLSIKKKKNSKGSNNNYSKSFIIFLLWEANALKLKNEFEL